MLTKQKCKVIIGKRGGVDVDNFERIKQCESEYEMADLICGYFFNNIYKMRKKGGGYTSLPFLYWLQSDRDIFDEDKMEGGQR